LDTFIDDSSKKMETAEADFKKFVEGLQKSYEEHNKAKDQTVEDIKNSGLGFAKAVKASNHSLDSASAGLIQDACCDEGRRCCVAGICAFRWRWSHGAYQGQLG